MEPNAPMRGHSSDTSFWLEESSSGESTDTQKINLHDILMSPEGTTDTDERALSVFCLPPQTAEYDAGSNTVIAVTRIKYDEDTMSAANSEIPVDNNVDANGNINEISDPMSFELEVVSSKNKSTSSNPSIFDLGPIASSNNCKTSNPRIFDLNGNGSTNNCKSIYPMIAEFDPISSTNNTTSNPRISDFNEVSNDISNARISDFNWTSSHNCKSSHSRMFELDVIGSTINTTSNAVVLEEISISANNSRIFDISPIESTNNCKINNSWIFDFDQIDSTSHFNSCKPMNFDLHPIDLNNKTSNPMIVQLDAIRSTDNCKTSNSRIFDSHPIGSTTCEPMIFNHDLITVSNNNFETSNPRIFESDAIGSTYNEETNHPDDPIESSIDPNTSDPVDSTYETHDPTTADRIALTSEPVSQQEPSEAELGAWKKVDSEPPEVKINEFRRFKTNRSHLLGSTSPTHQKLDGFVEQLNELNTRHSREIPSMPLQTRIGGRDVLKRRPGSILNKLGVDKLFDEAATVLRPMSPLLACSSPSCEGCGAWYMESQMAYLSTRQKEMAALNASMNNCSIVLSKRGKELNLLKEDLTGFKQELLDDIRDLELQEDELREEMKNLEQLKMSSVKKEISKEKKIRELNNNKASLRQRLIEHEDKQAECNLLAEDCRKLKAELTEDASAMLGIGKHKSYDIRKGLLPGLQLLRKKQISQYNRQMEAHKIIDDKFAAHGIPNPFKTKLMNAKSMLDIMMPDENKPQ